MKLFDFIRSKPSEDRFAELVIRQMRSSGWARPVAYDRARFALILGEDIGTLYLHNLHGEWTQARGADKQAVVASTAAFAQEQTKANDRALAEVAEALLPVVRNLSHLRNQWLEPAMEPDRDRLDYAVKEFCGALAVSIAEDRPDSISMFSARRLREWSRTVDDLLPIAIDNLRAISPSKFKRSDGSFFVSEYNDGYDASRLLLPELFANLPLRGDPVAVAASRNCLTVCGSREPDALTAMAKFVDSEVKRDEHAISYLPLILRDGSWKVYDFPDGNMPALSELRVKQQLWDYREQRPLLEAYFERTARDVFAASIDAVEHEGRWYSCAVWTVALQSLLPRVDALVLNLGDDDFFVRAWADVEAHCGPLQIEPGTNPVRHFAAGPPSAESLKSLRACRAPEWWPKPER